MLNPQFPRFVQPAIPIIESALQAKFCFECCFPFMLHGELLGFLLYPAFLVLQLFSWLSNSQFCSRSVSVGIM